MPVVVVDDGGEAAAWKQLHRWSVPVVRESSLSMASLAQAGIAQAAAVIAAHDADLANLETALLVADLTRRRHEATGRASWCGWRTRGWPSQLTAALPSAVVLSLPEKAGSSFVEGCIQSSLLHAFAFADERLEVVDVQATAGEQSTLRSAFGDLTPLALRPADGGPLVVCPPRDYELAPGDRVTLIGRPDDYQAVGRLSRDETEAEALIALTAGELDAHVRRRNRSQLSQRRATGCRRSPPRRTGRCASWPASVLGIIVFSTVLLRLAYHNHTVVGAGGHAAAFGWLQALYFTSTIVATVGFGDYSFAQEPAWLTAYGIFLIFVGAAAVATLYALVTNFIVTSRLEQAFGQQRATQGARPRHRRRPGRDGHPRGRGAAGRRARRRHHRARSGRPLPGPGPLARGAGRHR